MSGHGHVVPNADGSRARCGGPMSNLIHTPSDTMLEAVYAALVARPGEKTPVYAEELHLPPRSVLRALTYLGLGGYATKADTKRKEQQFWYPTEKPYKTKHVFGTGRPPGKPVYPMPPMIEHPMARWGLGG